jgi:hypothetical protein
MHIPYIKDVIHIVPTKCNALSWKYMNKYHNMSLEEHNFSMAVGNSSLPLSVTSIIVYQLFEEIHLYRLMQRSKTYRAESIVTSNCSDRYILCNQNIK